jgi:CHASE2 domain-containing sensor protein
MLTRLGMWLGHWTTTLARRFQNNFYIFLAVLFSVGILLDASVFHVGENMRQKAFDLIVRNRIIVPKPDPNIIIIDVDEASLSAMAGEFGRWPWPRQVFGEFLALIEQQQPKAIVFDILFSDPDVFNPDSDAYFNEVITEMDNVFFPFLRNEQQDSLSQVRPSMIPGIAAVESNADPDATIAVVLPHFEGALKPGKLGTINIHQDPDGIVREYLLWQDKDGWRIPSLPLAVGNFLQPEPISPPRDMLVNWRGGPFTYQTISFSDAYRDMTAKTPQRPQNEFTNKIVIIGSTAPGLFDLQATAMAKAHPGVEILATAIDNVNHSDYLRFWRGALPYVSMSLLVIWLTAAALYRNVDRDRFNRVFSRSQIGMLAVSYVSVNLTNTYFDLTAPVTWAVAYFSIAKVYALATDRAMQRWLALGVKPGAAGMHAVLMPVQIVSQEPLGDALLKKLRREIEGIGQAPKSVEALKGIQKGIWGLFGDMLVISWTCDGGDETSSARIRDDAAQISEQLPDLLAQAGLPPQTSLRHVLHEGILNGDHSVDAQWRSLFAQAILELEHEQSKKA